MNNADIAKAIVLCNTYHKLKMIDRFLIFLLALFVFCAGTFCVLTTLFSMWFFIGSAVCIVFLAVTAFMGINVMELEERYKSQLDKVISRLSDTDIGELCSKSIDELIEEYCIEE